MTALPAGVRSRVVDNHNGLQMYLLEAGVTGAPCVLLLHGFPELAYSWRKIMPPLAEAGFYVVAPDQRGYGNTTGQDTAFEGDLAPFGMLNLTRDVLGLLHALEVRQAVVVGHDFGAPVASICALARPDVFTALALMSHPFGGPPGFAPGRTPPDPGLAALDPPRKHYQWYYSTAPADANMREAPQGVHAFLRAYYHMKSADWPGNTPFPLTGWTAEELAKMPEYYIMARDLGMAETVAPHMPAAAPAWLTDDELAVYAEAFGRTGFQGGLQWYRANTSGLNPAELRLFAGRTIDVPAVFIAGAQDWGVQQVPGSLDAQARACTQLRGVHLIEGAGHWVQQEQAAAVTDLLLAFLR